MPLKVLQPAIDRRRTDARSGWPEPEPAARAAWRAERLLMERARVKFSPFGRVPIPRVKLLQAASSSVRWLAGVAGLSGRIARTALDIQRTELELAFDHLPPAFDGYTIVQIADPHFDSLPGLDAAIAAAIDGLAADLVVLTGDYRMIDTGAFDRRSLTRALGLLQDAINPADGVLAILGNHDTATMIEVLEGDFGIRVLVNETVDLRRGRDRLEIVGTDDPHRFHGARAADFLERLGAATEFRIALVHSPELASPMAELGAALYLCGHTHSGQICLPGGRPLICQLHAERALARGLWRRGEMVGYTSAGAGVSGSLPLRLNSRSEVVRIRLRRRAPIPRTRE